MPTFFSRLGMVLLSAAICIAVAWWAVVSLLPVIFPLNRDLHMVVAKPALGEATAYYFVAFSTIDHRIQVVELPTSLRMSTATDSATLADWSRTASSLPDRERRAHLSKALSVPLDETVTLPSENVTQDQKNSQTLKTSQVRAWWWKLARARNHWAWWAFVRQTPSDRIEISEAQDQVAWQKMLPRLSRASAFVQCTVAVVNTTGVRGLATDLSNILENADMNVIRVGDTAQKEPVSKVLVASDAPDCAAQARLVANVSPVEVQVVTDSSLPKQYRAKIVWLVGEELSQ